MELLIGLIILILDVIAIIGVIQSSSYDTLRKLIWIAIILVLPFIGMLIWFLVGNKKKLF